MTVSLEHRQTMLSHLEGQQREAMTLATIAAVHYIADKIAERLLSALRRTRIATINIDIIRAACEVAAQYEGLTAQELVALEESVTRRIAEKSP